MLQPPNHASAHSHTLRHHPHTPPRSAPPGRRLPAGPRALCARAAHRHGAHDAPGVPRHRRRRRAALQAGLPAAVCAARVRHERDGRLALQVRPGGGRLLPLPAAGCGGCCRRCRCCRCCCLPASHPHRASKPTSPLCSALPCHPALRPAACATCSASASWTCASSTPTAMRATCWCGGRARRPAPTAAPPRCWTARSTSWCPSTTALRCPRRWSRPTLSGSTGRRPCCPLARRCAGRWAGAGRGAPLSSVGRPRAGCARPAAGPAPVPASRGRLYHVRAAQTPPHRPYPIPGNGLHCPPGRQGRHPDAAPGGAPPLSAPSGAGCWAGRRCRATVSLPPALAGVW